jgi:hypothetical protein
MFYTFHPILGLLAIAVAGTLAAWAFRVLDRHENGRSR